MKALTALAVAMLCPLILPAQAADSTTLILLGTGTPRPPPEKMGPATAVVVGKRVFLFDAGVGVERRLFGAGLPVDGVTAAFITHLHSDHVLVLPDLFFSSFIFGRKSFLACTARRDCVR